MNWPNTVGPSVRRRRRPLRDVLIYLLWKNGEYTLADIGSYFQVEYTTVSNARTRGPGQGSPIKVPRRKGVWVTPARVTFSLVWSRKREEGSALDMMTGLMLPRISTTWTCCSGG